MADQFKFVQAQPFTLAGAGAVLGDVSIIFSSMQTIDGVNLAMTDFGSIGYMTLEPGSGTQEEQISFSGLTQNSNGTATITGVKNVLFIDPYTETTGLAKTHAGGTQGVVSNTSGFYNKLTSKADDETITGVWTFTNPNYPKMDTATPAPTDDGQFATKKYVDDTAVAGAPNATLTVKGIVEISTTAEINSGATTGGTGASVVVRPDQLTASIYGLQLPSSAQKAGLASTTTPSASNLYITQTDFQKGAEVSGSTTGSSNAYLFAPSPAIAAYTAGMCFRLKANFTNTTAATLNVSTLGAIAIKKLDGATALVAGDIVSGQEFVVVYDGTNFQMVSPSAVPPVLAVGFKNGTTTRNGSAASGTQNIAHGLGVTPKKIRITGIKGIGATQIIMSFGTYNGTTTSCVYGANSGTVYGNDSTNVINIGDGGGASQAATVTYDATNIILSWTKAGSPSADNINIMWEAEA